MDRTFWFPEEFVDPPSVNQTVRSMQEAYPKRCRFGITVRHERSDPPAAGPRTSLRRTLPVRRQAALAGTAEAPFRKSGEIAPISPESSAGGRFRCDRAHEFVGEPVAPSPASRSPALRAKFDTLAQPPRSSILSGRKPLGGPPGLRCRHPVDGECAARVPSILRGKLQSGTSLF